MCSRFLLFVGGVLCSCRWVVRLDMLSRFFSWCLVFGDLVCLVVVGGCI